MSENLVQATLGQPAFIDGEIRPTGYVALVPEHMKASLEYVPPQDPNDGLPPGSLPAVPTVIDEDSDDQ